jgi:RNA polymerase sigma-70 factor (ECF subfamily)
MDKAVIKAAQGGDIEAFEQLYQDNSDFVWRVVVRMVNNTEEAKDLAQDIFVKVYQELPKYRFEAKFKTWLYRIAFTTTLNRIKKLKIRRDKAEDIYRHQEQDAGEEASSSDQLLVKQLLAGLNEVQRSCVVLRDIEGLSYEEVGHILKIKTGTVRSNLNRARHKMRKNWHKKEAKGHG